jgi:hypothetical protein
MRNGLGKLLPPEAVLFALPHPTGLADRGPYVPSPLTTRSDEMATDKVTTNQKKILANQRRIEQNQAKLDTLIRNQRELLANQKKILANQKKIMGK